jgi:hypothetical protein
MSRPFGISLFAVLADRAGLSVLGEHHRPDFATASPPVVLAAVAQRHARARRCQLARPTCDTPRQPWTTAIERRIIGSRRV